MSHTHFEPVNAEILQAEDDSHLLLVVPWYADDDMINQGLQHAKELGYPDITSQGNFTEYESQGCSDWDYYRMEPPCA